MRYGAFACVVEFLVFGGFVFDRSDKQRGKQQQRNGKNQPNFAAKRAEIVFKPVYSRLLVRLECA